jgi:hypothetical protein
MYEKNVAVRYVDAIQQEFLQITKHLSKINGTSFLKFNV